MRKLMWFSLGFAAGMLPLAYILWRSWFLVIAAVVLLCAVGLLFLRRKATNCMAAMLFGLFAATLWFWGYDALYMRPARMQDGQTVNTTILIADYSYESGYGIAADGELKLDGRSFKVRVYLPEMESVKPGDTVTGSFSLRLTVNGGQQEATYHQGKGIFLLAFAEDSVETQRSAQTPARFLPAKLRHDILELLDRTFPADVLGFARALLLGDSTKLSYEIDSAFKVSGIRHVIAVSGLHVSILFALVYLLCGKQRFLTALLGVPALLLFAAVAGFTPSIVRACIMQGVMILAMLFKRDYDPPTALSFAVLIILMVNPMTITAVSFQLSVGCMVGIFLFCGKLNEYFVTLFHCQKGNGIVPKLLRGIAGGISVTLSAMVVTTPLSIFYFGTVSLIGLLTNLLSLWVISFVFYGIMLACLAGALWTPLGVGIAWIIAWPIRYVLLVAKLLSAVPFGAVYTCSAYILAWVVCTYLFIAIFIVLKKKHPWVLTAGIALTLAIAITFSCVEPRLDDVRVTVMDVGQGQAVLLQSKGQTYLVDCGGDDPETAADIISQQLLSQGILKLDGMILTHYDADHAGAADYVLSRVPAKTLYLPDITDDSEKVKEQLLTKWFDRVCLLRRTETITGNWGTLTLVAGKTGGNENENSMCVLFQAGNCDILITGDRGRTGELALIEDIRLPELELLVVGHHGASSSTCFELLYETKPKNAVISVGEDNRYGHPASDVLMRLEMAGCRVWRTDLQGTIVFRG